MRIAITKVRTRLPDVLKRVEVRRERVVITRHGLDVAVLVPIEDLVALRRLEDKIDLRAARAALAEMRKKGTVPWKHLKADLNRQRNRGHGRRA